MLKEQWKPTNSTFSQETFHSVCVSTCSISKTKCACTHPHLEYSHHYHKSEQKSYLQCVNVLFFRLTSEIKSR